SPVDQCRPDQGLVSQVEPERARGPFGARLSRKYRLQSRLCGLVALTKCEALMLGWFRALMPREERFFELFTRHAQVTLAGAEALRALLKGDDVQQCCREITKRENEADEITREILTALRRSFITPLDRGDIKDLITSMDDAIDQ